MKRLIPILLILLSFTAMAQKQTAYIKSRVYDDEPKQQASETVTVPDITSEEELKRRVLELEANQKHIQLSMDKHQRQFRTGTMFLLSGLVATVAHFITDSNKEVNSDGTTRDPVLLYLGPALVTVGAAIQLDSHRHLGQAGQRKKVRIK